MIRYIKINCEYLSCNKIFSKEYANQLYCSIKCREERHGEKNLSDLGKDLRIIRKKECSEKKCHEDSVGWINKKIYCEKHFNIKKFTTPSQFKRRMMDPTYLKW